MRVRKLQWFSTAVLVALMTASVAHAADGVRTEVQSAQVENLIGEILGSNLATPEYTDYGQGLHSLYVPLDSSQRERLSALLGKGAGDKAVAYYFLAGGQSLTPPSNPTTLIHAALSNTQLGYNYWVVVVNLGSNVTKNTTFKLTGPGRTFNRTAPLLYRANGIWTYWYSIPGVGAPGFYHFASTVAGAGTFTIHTFAVNP